MIIRRSWRLGYMYQFVHCLFVFQTNRHTIYKYIWTYMNQSVNGIVEFLYEGVFSWEDRGKQLLPKFHVTGAGWPTHCHKVVIICVAKLFPSPQHRSVDECLRNYPWKIAGWEHIRVSEPTTRMQFLTYQQYMWTLLGVCPPPPPPPFPHSKLNLNLDRSTFQPSNEKTRPTIRTVVGWLLNVPAICKCIWRTDLLRQLHVLPHWDRSCRPNFPSHPVTVYWHRANKSEHWPYNTRRLAGEPLECQCLSR